MYKASEDEKKIRKISTELFNANRELGFLIVEKEKRASELLIANKELSFQNEEKGKRASELLIANKELSFQNEEKGKRASELLIANKELSFQNEEKGKRAAELLIANKELSFQNEEKGKRAAELIAANIELVFQSEEKANRASELLLLKEELLFHEKQLFEKTLFSIGDGVISADVNRNILYMNKVAEDLTGWTMTEGLGKPIYTVLNIMDEYTRRNNDNIVERVFATRTIQKMANHSILITKDKAEKLIEDSAAPIHNKHGELVGIVIVFRDYTEKGERLKKIEYLNFHDDLTGLYNRRFFEEELLRLDTKRNLPLSIIMGDINGLKLINDSFGHKFGDELLIKSANAIVNGCREDDIIARIGGDEFAIILPSSSSEDSMEVINRIKGCLKKQNIFGIDVSVSFGCGCKTDISQNIQTIFKDAEDHMYKLKLFESSSLRSKTIEIISKTLFEKNGRELVHSKRVSELCGLLAEKLEFDINNVNILKLTGLMHDIGKIGIEDIILNKKGKLTDEEYSEMKRHPEIGYRILNSVNEFSDIATAVLQHHEKWDGSGYPQGLKGKEICVEARIVCIADAFDAMTSLRSYRTAIEQSDAILEIERCRGTHFDPDIARQFIEMITSSSVQN
jgi:diguanylate cyclase (GGDEF)-like protein/PAS domain S-box-containing protein/putative nucleotidyltransferase with HDIG domain